MHTVSTSFDKTLDKKRAMLEEPFSNWWVTSERQRNYAKFFHFKRFCLTVDLIQIVLLTYLSKIRNLKVGDLGSCAYPGSATPGNVNTRS